MITIFGIPNCDTVKKVKNQIEDKKIDFDFVNFKKTPPTASLIKKWKKELADWPVNKRGPTFRKIKEDFESANTQEKIELLIANTSAIKRPIVEKAGKLIFIGNDQEAIDKL